jgi:heterodisulfide reductase subunit A-like polyferredoxin
MRYSLRSESALQLLNLISLVAAAFPNRPRDTTFAAAQNQTYDYVIVGGGITGLVAANRLSEDPTSTWLEVN